jgi:hypothetical protein
MRQRRDRSPIGRFCHKISSWMDLDRSEHNVLYGVGFGFGFYMGVDSS